MGALLLGAGVAVFLLGLLWPPPASPAAPPSPQYRPRPGVRTVIQYRTRLQREAVMVVVYGESSQTVAQTLQVAGVIPSADRFLHDAGQAAWHFHPGVFRFRLPAREKQVLRELTAP